MLPLARRGSSHVRAFFVPGKSRSAIYMNDEVECDWEYVLAVVEGKVLADTPLEIDGE
jgi:hypothetical protein